MESKNKIYILNTERQVLYEFDLGQEEDAFLKAEELEKLGIDFTLSRPSLPESLGNSLGVFKKSNGEENLNLKLQLHQELTDEINSHNSCCFEKNNVEKNNVKKIIEKPKN